MHAPRMYAEPAAPTWDAVSSRPAPFSVRRPPSAPTIVTARPSRIQTVPSPMTIIQCHRDQGRRSIRAGMSVSIVRRATLLAAVTSTSLSPADRPLCQLVLTDRVGPLTRQGQRRDQNDETPRLRESGTPAEEKARRAGASLTPLAGSRLLLCLIASPHGAPNGRVTHV